MDQVITNMKADIPDAMVDSRIDELVQDFEYRISQQGLKLADYLKYMGMNIEQFRAQFKEQADKQVKMRLAMELSLPRKASPLLTRSSRKKLSALLTLTRWKPTRLRALWTPLLLRLIWQSIRQSTLLRKRLTL